MVDDKAKLEALDQRVIEVQAQLAAAHMVESQLAGMKSSADLARAEADHETDAQASLKKMLDYCSKQRNYLLARKALKGDENGLSDLAITTLGKQEAYYRSVLR